MKILQEIQKWSGGLVPWQQEAMARLYAQHELSPEDDEDLYAFLKLWRGVLDPEGRQPKEPDGARASAAAGPRRLVQIAAIKNLCNVNAIAERQILPIEPTGLTVIYGPNGSGKSGYARVLKKACRARDPREPIHPDARLPPGSTGAASAEFDILVDGTSRLVKWTGGAEPPEELAAIAIFDSHCARAYVDNQGDFAYAPYGLDILEGLARACERLKGKLSAEIAANAVNLEPFAVLARTATKAGTLAAGLSGETDPKDVEAHAGLDEDQFKRLAELVATLSEADPKQKANVLRLRAERFSKLAAQIRERLAAFSDEKVGALRRLVLNATEARQAADLAARSFKEAPGRLLGTGGEAWQRLFEAARSFTPESHPGRHFPNLGSDSQCPLCQQPLGDEAAARLVEFDAFIQAEAEKAARSARAAAEEVYRETQAAECTIGLDTALSVELAEAAQPIAQACSTLDSALAYRKAAILEACKPGADWGLIESSPEDSSRSLDRLVAELVRQAEAFDKALDEIAKAAMIAERDDLEARRLLGELKATTLDAIAKLSLRGKLRTCEADITTTAISKKSTELTQTVATQDLKDALNRELDALDVADIRVAMKPQTEKGKTSFKLVLELPGGIPPKDILSEGEQRAIAIASLLAEVGMSGDRGGIIFDDPVSSLDHRRRWHVARRLALEATRRQIIVFTHDLYFLCILQQVGKEIGPEVEPRCLRRAPEGFGVPGLRVPFDGLTTKARVGTLRRMQEEAERMRKTGDEEGAAKAVREAYRQLRMAWERAVEEILLNESVQRFNEAIATKRLQAVVVEDDDYKRIDAAMTHCSKFEHDGAAPAHGKRPAIPS